MKTMKAALTLANIPKRSIRVTSRARPQAVLILVNEHVDAVRN